MSGRVPGDCGGWRKGRKGRGGDYGELWERGGGQASEIIRWNLSGEKEN